MATARSAAIRRPPSPPSSGGSTRAVEAGARPLDPGTPIEPMLAFERVEPFSKEGWIFELKLDGFRLLAAKAGDRIVLRYRSGHDATRLFPEIVQAVRALPAQQAILDGEVIACDAQGRPSFEALQRRALGPRAGREAAIPAAACFFDLLVLDGFDLRPLPLLERKRLLAELVPAGRTVHPVGHLEARGEALFAAAVRDGHEGIVAKRARSPYVSGRSRDWLKIKHLLTDEFVVIGLARPSGASFDAPALHLARTTDDGLRYAGRVAVGPRTVEAVRRLPARLRQSKAPCTGAPALAEAWLEPALRCRVRFLASTRAGLLREPVFLGFCDQHSE